MSFTTAYQYVYLNGGTGNWIGGNTYWQSDVFSRISARTLYFNSTRLNLQDGFDKGYGFAFRCLAPLEKGQCWQLPTYSGTKSYQDLLVEVYGGQNTDWLSWSDSHIDAALHVSAINLIRGGFYAHSVGSVNNLRDNNGYFWSLRAASDTDAKILYFHSTLLHSQASSSKGYGFQLRCLVR